MAKARKHTNLNIIKVHKHTHSSQSGARLGTCRAHRGPGSHSHPLLSQQPQGGGCLWGAVWPQARPHGSPCPPCAHWEPRGGGRGVHTAQSTLTAITACLDSASLPQAAEILPQGATLENREGPPT